MNEVNIDTKTFTPGTVKLSEASENKLQELIARYPDRHSAVMPALYLAQEELGWVNDQAVQWVSERLAMPPAHVWEVATFYTMYYQKPVGKYHIQVCRTLSCMLVGAQSLSKHLEEKLGVKAHQVTSDGVWSFEEVECLGSCGSGPMAQINGVYFERLNPEKLDALMEKITAEQPDLGYSTVKGGLGKGLPEQPRSEVWSKKS